MKFSYVLRRVFSMNSRGMLEKVKEVSDKSGKSKLTVFFDMVYCGFKYQAGYMDYGLFEMYNLNKAQRKTVVTRGINNSLIKRFNNPDYRFVFDDKRKFNETFSSFISRDWLDLEKTQNKDFENFINKYPQFFAKPYNGMCGKGIEKINASDFSSVNELKTYLFSKSLMLLEEPITQHYIMNSLHPYSVNTCRVITIVKDGKPYVVAAYLRIGNGGHVDNFNSGGMVVPIEEGIGEVIYPAINKKSELFEVHPITGVCIKGFKIPMWTDVAELAKKAALVVPQVGLVGWDIALTEKGPLIVEGNDFPGHDIYGLPPHRKDGIGVLPKFEKILYN